MIKLPKTKLNYGHLSLKIYGGENLNEPPLEIRKQCLHKSFESSLKKVTIHLIFSEIIEWRR